MGPALHEEGGSLWRQSQRAVRFLRGNLRRATATQRHTHTRTHPAIAGGRASKRRRPPSVAGPGRAGQGRAEGRGERGHVPTEVSELLVDALESHGVVWLWVWGGLVVVGAGGGVAQRVWKK